MDNSINANHTKAGRENKVLTDLWQLTRTEEIEDNWNVYRITDTKKIAALVRQHIKSRFPMCRWSVRKESHSSIYIELLESPFDIDSEAVKAIVNYAYCYLESFNYDNCDIMADYFDVNFYNNPMGSFANLCRYRKREANEAEKDMEKAFMENKKTHDEEFQRKREEKTRKLMKWHKEEKDRFNQYMAERKSDDEMSMP